MNKHIGKRTRNYHKSKEIKENIKQKFSQSVTNSDEKITDLKKLLIPQKLANNDIDWHYPENPLVENDILPRPPFSLLVIGGTGSGKSNTIIYLLRKHYIDTKIFLKNNCYLFSPTGKMDPLMKHLNIRDDNIITDDILNNIIKLTSKQIEDVKSRGIKKSDRLLLIIEDSTDNAELLNHGELKLLFTRNRHINMSICLVCHKYKCLNRTSRLNSNNIIMFQADNSELEQLIQDYCIRVPGLTKAETNRKMYELIDYAFTKTDEDKKPFLYLNNKKPDARFHKGFYENLQI